MPDYQVFVVDMEGTPFAGSGDDDELKDAEVTRLSRELNGVGGADITLATTDPDAALLIPGREVQIWWDGSIIWWGPIVRPQAGLNKTTWQCAGLLWYFAHRYMGRADRINQLSNGDFEAGETGWSFTGVTHSISTSQHIEEPSGQSLKLTGGTVDHKTYASQTWTHPAGGYPTGDFLTGSVWVKVPSSAYVDGAFQNRGLLLAHRDAAGNVVDVQVATIGDDTVKDEWIELETGVANVLPGHTVEMRLYPPHGDAYFDLATLTFMESLSFGYPAPPVDVTDIIGGIVAYAQNPSSGKSDLNIAFGGSDTGVLRQIAYQFAEHRNILDAILEYVRQGICDVSVELTATTRTFMVWPKSSDTRTPKLGKGSLYSTTLQLDTNLSDFTYSIDLEQAASDVVLLGPGDGPDRPEGSATDPSFVGGAFTAEIVEQAPDNVTVGQLDARARERLATAAHPEILQVITLPGSGVIGDVADGDTVPIVVASGWVDIVATYRVASIEADLLKDQATLTLNAVPS
jgi:hypothetical protein